MLELFERYKVNKPIRLIELFAGYGSQALALKNIGADFEHYKVVEFDKYVVETYNALHDTNFKVQDITQVHDLNIVDKDKYDYIMTYSFPCTDLSLAGKGLGMGKGTRSGLLWEVERLLKENELPQILIMENVPQVHGTKFKEDFYKWTQFLAKLGYSNQWEDLNAKHYGIPQNRNRTFMVSILGDYEYSFPKKKKLNLQLKDILEEETEHQSIKQSLYNNLVIRKEVGRLIILNGTKHGETVGYPYDGLYVNQLTGGGYFKGGRGRVQTGMSPTLMTSNNNGYITKNLGINLFTPIECFRLMGLSDEQIDLVFTSGNSNAQLYKQAGNSIVVQVLENIFKELICL